MQVRMSARASVTASCLFNLLFEYLGQSMTVPWFAQHQQLPVTVVTKYSEERVAGVNIKPNIFWPKVYFIQEIEIINNTLPLDSVTIQFMIHWTLVLEKVPSEGSFEALTSTHVQQEAIIASVSRGALSTIISPSQWLWTQVIIITICCCLMLTVRTINLYPDTRRWLDPGVMDHCWRRSEVRLNLEIERTCGPASVSWTTSDQ